MITVERYNPEMLEQWNTFVLSARNSTLLHLREYMDYHSDRFEDASLVFSNDKGHIVSLLPACKSNNNPKVVVSHQGLTYGGFLFAPQTHTAEIEEVFDAALTYYKQQGFVQLITKPIPQIYCKQPNEEELYFISRHNGVLTSRYLSQAINLDNPLTMSELRKRCIAKARKNNIIIEEATNEADWSEFHNILTNILTSRHSTTPVHTADELWMLHQRFPQQIKLYGAYSEGKIIAGTIVYFSPTVAHTQYLASSPEGQEKGALDLIVNTLLTLENVRCCRYLDFGVSTERDGSLNHGLTLQKEGFGARGVCYDSYSIDL